MRVPLSWLREYVDLPADLSAAELAGSLTMLGLNLETLELPGSDVSGPLVVGRVLEFEPETHSNGKTIRWCQVDVGEAGPRGIVCGAVNFAVGDLVVVALPGAVLPGGFAIGARRTYGHVSDGMICSARELALGDDHTGILVLASDEGRPGDDAAPLLHLRDEVLDLEVNPDRAYALSLRGVARDAAVGYQAAYHDPALGVRPVPAGAGYPVVVEDPAGCDVFAALEVTGLDPVARTPRWLARRVQLAGIRPISLAVDITNYVMLELGTPIHGYDRARLQGAIVVRRAAAGEKLRTLDGVLRQLDPDDLLITDDRGPIGLAGVMGGEATELGDTSVDLLIEAAHFDPATVARTARRHKLPSEAARRFERGVDATLPAIAASRVAELLVRYGGGRVADVTTVVGEPAARPRIALPAGLSARLAGVPIDEDTASAALRAVGCEVAAADGSLVISPPPWRADIRDPYDLVEEVLRVVGYDAVPSIVPSAPVGRGLTRGQRLRRRVGRALAAAGYVETPCYPFVGPADWVALDLPEGDERRLAVRLANPLSAEDPLLRTTLLPGLLRALGRNVARGSSDVGLFEAGAVFSPGPDVTPPPRLRVDRRPSAAELSRLEDLLPRQPQHLAVVACGHRGAGGWWGPAPAASWADAVEAVRTVCGALGLAATVSRADRPPWHPGRAGGLVVNGSIVGYAGELHPRVCAAYEVPERTVAAEVDLDLLVDWARPPAEAPRLSSYPAGKEDVSLVVDAAVPAQEVRAALVAGAGPLLESVRLFDLYVGPQVGAGRKSLGYRLVFRAADRTLTEGEIAAARDAAVAAAAERTGAAQRT